MAKQNNIAFANVRAAMAKAENMTIGELAALVEMNRDTLSRKLSMSSPINLDEALKISRVLGGSVEELFQELFATDNKSA